MSFRVPSPAAAAELQNHAAKFDFAIRKAAWRKKARRDFFDKPGRGMPRPAPHGRPVLSSIKTIASVAAVSDRLAGWHYLRHKFIGAMPQVCHSEERSDVGISQYHVGSWESYRRNRDCLPEIATSAAPPRNDNSGGRCRFGDSPYESFVQRRERHAAPLQWLVRSAKCHQTYKPRRDRFRFNGGRYESAVPSRDCHGRKAPSQ